MTSSIDKRKRELWDKYPFFPNGEMILFIEVTAISSKECYNFFNHNSIFDIKIHKNKKMSTKVSFEVKENA